MIPEPVERIRSYFDLGTPRRIVDMGGTRNRNYVVETDRGQWVLRRRHVAFSSDDWMGFDAAAADYLAGRGVAVVPLRSGADGPWLRIDGAVWQVQPFVEGGHLRDGHPADLRALGEALARWHEAGRDFSPRFTKAAPRAEADPALILATAARIEAESPHSTGILAAYGAAVERAASALSDSDYAALPHSLIHGDVQPANVLVEGDHVSAFVDLDWCCRQARLYDLCNAIMFCCAGHLEPVDGGDIASITQPPILDSTVVAGFLEAYGRVGGGLTAAERAALIPLLMLTWCHARINGALKTPSAARRAFLERPPDVSTESWLNLPEVD